MGNIHFFSEETDFNPKGKSRLRQWIGQVIEHYGKKLTTLNYIFTTDRYLHKINKTYLNHDSYTDIITFDHSSEADENIIEGDIFISIDRISENAGKLNVLFEDELHRVMVHGVLHLIGYGDKTIQEKKEMRKTENHWLNLRP